MRTRSAIEHVHGAMSKLAAANAPRRYPINFAFSFNGTECLSHLFDAWHETGPTYLLTYLPN